MIDCIDKLQQQQQRPQQPQQQGGGRSSFWTAASNPYHNHLHRATSDSAPSQALNQTSKTSQQILIDVQPDELSSNTQISQQAAPAQQLQANNELIGYYFGSISRETAEWILLNHGQQLDGAYLLRSSGSKDDFVLSLLVVHGPDSQSARNAAYSTPSLALAISSSPAGGKPSANSGSALEVLHYKIVETEDSFVALHGQVGDEKFATIDELIERAQGVATKPKWPIQRQSLESQILPPTFWGLTVDQIRLAILIKAKQWGFPLSIFQQPVQNGYDSESCLSVGEANGAASLAGTVGNNLQEQHQQQPVNTLNNETIRTLIYKGLHEFQPWFHGRIGRDEAERRIEEKCSRDGRFLVRERDNFSYAMCISHRRTTKHYRIDVLSTGELAIQDGRKFTSLMALVSHYTLMSDGLWCALTEACPRPIQQPLVASSLLRPAVHIQAGGQKRLPASETSLQNQSCQNQAIYCTAPAPRSDELPQDKPRSSAAAAAAAAAAAPAPAHMCSNQSAPVLSIKVPIKEWLLTINNKWSQMLAGTKPANGQPSQSLNSFLFGSSNPLNNHCRHKNHHHHRQHQHSHHHHQHRHHNQRKGSKAHQADQPVGSHRSVRQHGRSSNGATKQQPAGLPAGPCRCCPPIEPVASNNQQAQAGRHMPAMNQMAVAAGQCHTKALLSSLPQGPGFMLDAQSFIGSPLFAVRSANPQQPNGLNGVGLGRGVGQAAPIGLDGGSNDSRFAAANGNGMANNVEKLISPAQSVITGLDHVGLNPMARDPDGQLNPYALNTDFYGSQTSTAIVNDNLRTNSSSSSSSQRQINQPYQSGRLVSGLSHNPRKPQQHQAGVQVKYGAAQTPYAPRPPVQAVPGQIVCGQHAGPAFRYTNCTGNQANQCIHSSRRLDAADWSQQQTRAADDLHLLGATSGSQLVGPAALTKFVQFQDGQCLRTHRDTRSIHMAYLLSRQEALNVLNDRHQAAASRRLQQPPGPANYQIQQQQQQHKPISSWQNRASAKPCGAPEPNANPVNQQAESSPIEYDLIDCDGDGSGFQFKYDPKLIKSSSIETLCGIGDEHPDDSGGRHELDLNGFKSNSELLMSLNPLWSSIGGPKTPEHYPDQSPLVPITAEPLSGMCNGGDCIGSLARLKGDRAEVDGRGEETRELSTIEIETSHFDESWSKKHNLDELTTSLLAELTASLKAQVDLKNKRSGLFPMDTSEQSEAVQSPPATQIDQNQQQQQQQQQVETNPIDLIEEFDTLIRGGR